MVTIDVIEFPEPVCSDDVPHKRHRVDGTWRTQCLGRTASETPAPVCEDTGAIKDMMEIIYTAVRPVIERREMTDEQAVTYMMVLFDRLITTTIAERPDTAQRLLAAFERDITKQGTKQAGAHRPDCHD